MEALGIAVIAGAVGGGILGYWLSTHIHSVAASAASAVTRATTVHVNPVIDAAAADAGAAVNSAIEKAAS